ncbi:MAG: HAD family hydrolase [Candidatus Nanopelagicales bacterium]|jgi:putative hydrolase of the HAD superfamily
MGGPVVRTPFEMLRRVERVCGAPDRTFHWTGPFDPDADALWQQMQAGQITERDYWHERSEQAAPFTGSSEVRRLFGLAFADPAECIRPEAIATLEFCQERGLRTGILTNDMKDFNEPGWSDRVEFVQRVDAVVDGSITGVLKPDPRAFEIALESLGTAPEETLMIDDQPFNIAGAQRAGLQTVWFDVTDPAGSYERARALL